MQEVWLHQIWGNRLYESLSFEPHPYIPEGETPIVIDPGRYNTNGGPDFSNLKLRIGHITWAGNGEIHRNATDWLRHRHQFDPCYNNVILHIVLQDDGPITLQSGTPPITCRMQINPNLLTIAQRLAEDPQIPRCGSTCSALPSKERTAWLAKLFQERLERKCEQIDKAMDFFKGDIASATNLFLMRYLGSKVNNEPFEQIARRLSPSTLLKHKDSLLALEALLLGVGGLLESSDLKDPDLMPATSEGSLYRKRLSEEYSFLKHKYQLSSIPQGAIRMMRLRPIAFPHRRLAYLAALYYHSENLPGQLLRTSSISQLEHLLTSVSLSDYWHTHYHWGRHSSVTLGNIGRETIESIAINVVIPLQYYLSQQGSYRLVDPSSSTPGLDAHDIPPEQNSVVRRFSSKGLKPHSAYDSQALLQLYESYCEPHRCWDCPVGRMLLQNDGVMGLPLTAGE